MDRAKLLLLILYLKDQENFFVEDYYKFRYIASRFSLRKDLAPVNIKLPVVCRKCSRVYDTCIGGAIKDACHECYDPYNPVAFNAQTLRYYYASRMAEILHCSVNVLEAYMSLAIYFIKTPSIAISKYGEILEKVTQNE